MNGPLFQAKDWYGVSFKESGKIERQYEEEEGKPV